MMWISGMSKILRMKGMLKMSDRHQTRTKCYTLLESQARVNLNDDGNFRNGGNITNNEYFRNFRNVENVRSDRQTPSVIHLQNHNPELIWIIMEISGMVGMSVRGSSNILWYKDNLRYRDNLRFFLEVEKCGKMGFLRGGGIFVLEDF